MDPEILLLDDATSAVDATTEREMRGSHGRAVCRENNAARFPTVVHSAPRGPDPRPHEGRLVASGTHAELVARDGLYRELFHPAS